MFATFFKAFGTTILGLFKSFLPLVYILAAFLFIIFLDFLITHFLYFRGRRRVVLAHLNIEGEPGFFEKLFILFPRQFWENYYNKKVGAFDVHGIIMFTGKQGQGKTLAETKYLMDMQHKFPDVKVCTNYGYLKEDESIDDWHKLVDYNNGEYGVICAIDECQNWFSSSMSLNFPPRMLATVTQNRKNRRVIIMSSHFFTNVSKPIRLHCTEVRSCRTFLGCLTLVHRQEPIMDGDGNVIKMRGLGWYFFVHSSDLYAAYDTYKVIENLSAAGFKDDDFTVIQGGIPDSAPQRRRSRRQRSALSEYTVNSNIDDVMNSLR